MTNLILCGGNGTRLWPISRTLMPKQFIKLFDGKSLFQLNLQRNKKLFKNHYVVSNAEQYFLAYDQIEDTHNLEDAHFLLEPIGRNTAPAIALACLTMDEDEIVLVSPSDQLIKNIDEYEKVIHQALELAKEDYLVTFGIKPEHPETGFGYIEADGTDVKAFHEKPDYEKAKQYVQSGNYYWNSGMFCFKAGVFLQELKKYSSDIYEASKKAIDNVKQEKLTKISHEDMANIPENSIDYAVMEKTDKIKVVCADMGWSDLGSFDALANEYEQDENGNNINENTISINSKSNFVYTSDRMVTLADVEDLIIVDTPDALLVTKKGSSQKIKDIVKELKGRETELHNIHTTAHRPWGTYTVLEDIKGYKIKRIEVKPNNRLSLQSHQYRNEHWIVVSGQATITLNDEVFQLNENESTYIKAGDKHRLSNETNEPLVIIEAQVGSYTGEDDIVRYDDDFRRK